MMRTLGALRVHRPPRWSPLFCPKERKARALGKERSLGAWHQPWSREQQDSWPGQSEPRLEETGVPCGLTSAPAAAEVDTWAHQMAPKNTLGAL